MKFLSPEVTLYLYKSTIQPCIEHNCHVWTGAPSCYLELLNKLQKRICRAVGASLAASLEPLVHCQNVASLSLFYRYYFGKCSSELAQLVLLPYSWGGSTHYSNIILIDCMIFLSPFLDVTRMSVNSFFPHIAKLWNSLPIECFHFTYDLNDLKSRINRHLLTVGFFLNRFPVCLNLFLFLFLVTPCLVVAVQPCMEWIPIKKKKTTVKLNSLLKIIPIDFELVVWKYERGCMQSSKKTCNLCLNLNIF